MARVARKEPAAKRRTTAARRAVAQSQPDFAGLHEQLLLYARDLNRVLKSERHKRRELINVNEQLIKYAQDLKKAHDAERRRAREVQAAYFEAVRRLVVAAEYKDEETANHIQRISHYARTLALELGWSEAQAVLIFDAAPMHDVGKIGVPDAILLKQGPLTPEEWTIMKRHPEIGESILAGSRSPLLAMAAEIAAGHHERYDGTGYPKGVKGDATPLPARIVMLCDVYDALRSRRPYKPAFDHAKSCEIILNGDGRTRPEHFDPRLLEIFARTKDRFGAIYDELRDD